MAPPSAGSSPPAVFLMKMVSDTDNSTGVNLPPSTLIAPPSEPATFRENLEPVTVVIPGSETPPTNDIAPPSLTTVEHLEKKHLSMSNVL